MNEIFTQVVAGIILLVIGAVFGRNVITVKHVQGRGGGGGKAWKFLVLIGWPMTILGGIASIAHIGQLYTQSTGISISLFTFGFLFLIIGKLGYWWNHR
jgi:hypothetical protein